MSFFCQALHQIPFQASSAISNFPNHLHFSLLLVITETGSLCLARIKNLLCQTMCLGCINSYRTPNNTWGWHSYYLLWQMKTTTLTSGVTCLSSLAHGSGVGIRTHHLGFLNCFHQAAFLSTNSAQTSAGKPSLTSFQPYVWTLRHFKRKAYSTRSSGIT